MTTYTTDERNPFGVDITFDEHIAEWETHLNWLKEMRDAGVRFEAVTECEPYIVEFRTTDPALAKQFALVEELFDLEEFDVGGKPN